MTNGTLGFRTPLDPEYAKELGAALYIFATLEHGVRWLGERLHPGFASWTQRKTAGQIAQRFVSLVANTTLLSEDVRKSAAIVAVEFQTLVEERNALMHSMPCTAPDGEQRLSDAVHAHGIWIPETVHALTARFEVTSVAANALLHGPFASLAAGSKT